MEPPLAQVTARCHSDHSGQELNQGGADGRAEVRRGRRGGSPSALAGGWVRAAVGPQSGDGPQPSGADRGGGTGRWVVARRSG